MKNSDNSMTQKDYIIYAKLRQFITVAFTYAKNRAGSEEALLNIIKAMMKLSPIDDDLGKRFWTPAKNSYNYQSIRENKLKLAIIGIK